MPIDPVTAAAATAAITKTSSWLWDKYGKDLLDRASKSLIDKVGREGKKLWGERQWKSSAEKYLQGLYEEVSWLRVLGKPEGQPIERLYTDVNVLDKISAEEWYGLHQLKEGYEVRRGLRWQHEQRQDGLALARKSQRLFILGKPGAGKTTFMKHIALQTIKGDLGEKIPIFISLHDLGNKGLTIVPYIVEQFRIHDFPEAEPFVRQLLKNGDGVVLFDGLDEVKVEGQKRDDLIAQMKDFIKEFHQNQIFITCRVAASQYTFERFTYVEMADFGDEQIKQFVFRWFQNDMTKRDNCWRELGDEGNATLRELAQVPVLLSLLCLVYEKRNEFPRERGEIYKQATDALLVEWDASRNIKRDQVYQNLSPSHKQMMLTQLAAETFAANEYFVVEEKLRGLIEKFLGGVPGLKEEKPDGVIVLQAMEAQHGILVERARGIHSFSHLTLQEYYAARYVVENEARGTLPRLMVNVGDERWQEVFLLTAGMLSDATDFCLLYLQAMQQMVAAEETIAALLQWGAIKSAKSGMPHPAFRAFYSFLALALDRVLARAIDQLRATQRYDDWVVGTPPLDDLDLDLTIDYARARALNLAFNLDHELDCDLDIALNLDHLDLDFTLARFLARARAQLAHTFASRPSHALDYLLIMFLRTAQSLVTARSFAKKLATELTELQETVIQLDQLCRDAHLPDLQAALASLPLPTAAAGEAELQAFATRLEEIARTHRDLGHDWNLSTEQLELLVKYFQANVLFVECLNLAYVPDRAAIESQILLPPGYAE